MTDEPATVEGPAAYGIDAFEPPGTPGERNRRREALRRAYAYLRERETARQEDFESDVFPEAPAGYDSPADGWWDQVVAPALRSLSDVTADEGGGRAVAIHGRRPRRGPDGRRTLTHVALDGSTRSFGSVPILSP